MTDMAMVYRRPYEVPSPVPQMGGGFGIMFMGLAAHGEPGSS